MIGNGSVRVISKNFAVANMASLDVALKNGAYDQFKRALKMKPEEVTQIVKDSGLRGHGGAGFSTGTKWGFIPKDKFPRYVTVNGDESEPGTCKDRLILERDPHLLLEGALICAYAVQAERVYVYIRGEYFYPTMVTAKAVQEAYAKGFAGKNILNSGWSCSIHMHNGAGAYICGEETGLLESMEGKKGWPRLKPPFYPAAIGLWGQPTIVNNVETLAFVPRVLEMGAEKFAALGSPKNGGTALYSLSGHVNKPGVYELPMGTLLSDLVYKYGGGIPNGRKLKAVIPGGSSSHILTAEECENLPLDFESVAARGSMLGSAAVMVIDDTVSIPKLMHWMVRFYAHESCGQCTPCREGCDWLLRLSKKFLDGSARKRDIDDMWEVANNIDGKTICALGAAVAWPTKSYLEKYRHEFEAVCKS
ncbi:MAG: NADH-quinone oxidoreductase subunit NuoF [bacterium]|nr:NADH-quinone oxidoreductase subunit NuoF [bacterium]MBK8130097.1 NADH-quinone oxidoreductase subunit NuoF [bacterium]